MSAAASHRAEVGLRACCWVWCARVQSVGPCSRYVCSLRCARVRVRARRAGASAPCAERVGFAPPAGCGARACRASGRARASSCVARVTCSHRRGGSAARADRAPARRECSQGRSSTGARAPGTPHACAGNGWGRCGARARARTGESPPRSLVDGSCPALEAAHPAAPGKPCASLHVTCRCTGAGGASTAAADGGGRSLRRMMPPGASPLSFSGSMGRVAPSAKIVFLGRLCFSQNFTKTHFSREALAPSHSVSTTERG